MNDKFYGFLGLAQRAGAVSSGAVACESALRKGKAKLVVLADDSSPELREEYLYFCEKHKIPLLAVPCKATLGSAIGKSPRVAVVITELNFSRRLQELYIRDNGGGRECPRSEYSS